MRQAPIGQALSDHVTGLHEGVEEFVGIGVVEPAPHTQAVYVRQGAGDIQHLAQGAVDVVGTGHPQRRIIDPIGRRRDQRIAERRAQGGAYIRSP